MWPGCGAGAMGMVILAIWPVARSAIEARPCTDLAGKCLPGIKPSGQGWWMDSPDGYHSRCAGMDYVNHWILACGRQARMTTAQVFTLWQAVYTF